MLRNVLLHKSALSRSSLLLSSLSRGSREYLSTVSAMCETVCRKKSLSAICLTSFQNHSDAIRFAPIRAPCSCRFRLSLCIFWEAVNPEALFLSSWLRKSCTCSVSLPLRSPLALYNCANLNHTLKENRMHLIHTKGSVYSWPFSDSHASK